MGDADHGDDAGPEHAESEQRDAGAVERGNNQQTSNNVIAGILSVSAAGNLGRRAGALTLGGTQTGGGATNGTLLDDDGAHVGGEHHDGGRRRDAAGEHRADETLSGNVANAAGLTVGDAGEPGTLTLSGVVSGAGGITVGGGTLILSNVGNTNTGGATVTGGTLQVAADALGGPRTASHVKWWGARNDPDIRVGACGDGGRGGRHIYPEQREDADAVRDLSGSGAVALTGTGWAA